MFVDQKIKLPYTHRSNGKIFFIDISHAETAFFVARYGRADRDFCDVENAA